VEEIVVSAQRIQLKSLSYYVFQCPAVNWNSTIKIFNH